MHAHTHTHSTYHHGLGVSVQQSNFITVNFMYYLTGLKSTAPPFHYSEGNNFIKLEHWLKLVKECVYILCDWKPLDWICHYASVQGLWGLPAHAGAITTTGKIHEKCYYWSCFMGVGVELVNEIYAGLWENWFTLLDHVVNTVKRWATVGFPENEQTEWKAFQINEETTSTSLCWLYPMAL